MAVTNLQLGSLILNTELLVALAAGIMGLLAIKLRLRSRAERDTTPAWNAIGIWIAVWKGSLLLTDAAGVMRQPLSLLYYDGGTLGFWLACAATAGYLRFRYGRLYGSAEGWGAAAAFASGWSVIYLIAMIGLDSSAVHYGHWFALFAAFAIGLAGVRVIGARPEQGKSGLEEDLDSLNSQEEAGTSSKESGSDQGEERISLKTKRGSHMARRILQTVAVAIVLGLLSYTAHGQLVRIVDKKAAQGNGGGIATGARVGLIAPSIELDSLSYGDSVSLDSLKGKTVLVNFWTTWCRVCMTEMPHVQQLYEQYREEGGDVAILSVNVTSQERSAADVRDYIDKYSLDFPILLDPSGETADAYRVPAYPATFIVDGEGVIRERFLGAISYGDMRKRIERVRDRHPSEEADNSPAE